MACRTFAALAASAALLAGCDGRIGTDETSAEAGAEAAEVSPEGKAETGKVTIRAPGIDMSINVPDALARRATSDSQSRIIPPGATFSGIHIEGAPAADQGARGGVEFRFAAPRPPSEVAAWYRQPREEFTIDEARQEGETFVISGTMRGDGNSFSVRLSPGEGGGTDGRVAIRDRG